MPLSRRQLQLKANQSASQARLTVRHWPTIGQPRCRAGCGAALRWAASWLTPSLSGQAARPATRQSTTGAAPLTGGSQLAGVPPAGRQAAQPVGRAVVAQPVARRAAAAVPARPAGRNNARPASKAIRKNGAYRDAPVKPATEHSAWAKAGAPISTVVGGRAKMVRPFVETPGARSGAAGAGRHAIARPRPPAAALPP